MHVNKAITTIFSGLVEYTQFSAFSASIYIRTHY